MQPWHVRSARYASALRSTLRSNDGAGFGLEGATSGEAATAGGVPIFPISHSLTAGVTAVLAKGGDLTDAIRTGAAAGAINVTRHGLGEGRADAIAELIPRVRVEPFKRGE